jgi:WD40 repeat protein
VRRADCVTKAELTAFHLGDLPESRLDAIAEHLEECPRCEALARALDGLSDPVIAAVRHSAAEPACGAQPLPSAVGDYKILDEIGRGGMGVVYRARHRRLGRLVALKMLLGGAFADHAERRRFRSEAAALARLRHPNIVQLYEVGEHDTGSGATRPYFTLELVEGTSLDDRLAGRPLAARQAATWLGLLARAVHYAHQQGVVHRDLKPANVLLDREDQPKLCDFGVAKLIAGSDLRTASGVLVGTAEYMAPEQAVADCAVGPATDVYALGALLYAMLTGHPPFRGATTFQTLSQVQVQEPVPPTQSQPAVPRDLQTICLKCLEKEPRRRYPSASALADDLSRFLANQPISARPVGLPERGWKWARRRPAVAGLSVAVVLVTAAALGLVTSQWRRAEGEAAQARRAEAAAEERRRHAEEMQAHLALEWGQALCERGDFGPGLLWLARALDRAAAAGTTGLDRPVRVNLADWGRQVRPWGTRLDNRSPVLGLTFDPADRTLLVAGKDGLVHFWDIADARERRPPLGHSHPTIDCWVSLVAFSPDGRSMATAGDQGARLWDAVTHEPNGAAFPHPRGMLWGMAFFPDGRRLATCGDDGAARVWDLATRRIVLGPLRHLGGAPSARTPTDRTYYTLAVSPDGRILVTAGDDGRVIRWDLDNGQPVGPALQHDSCVLKVVFTSDGRKLLTATSGGTLHSWDLRSGRGTDLAPQGTEVNGLALAPDGQRFATATALGVVRLWDPASLRPTGPVYRHEVGVSAVAFSRDGRRLAMGMVDGGIHVVDLPPSREASPPSPMPAEVCALQFTPGGNRLMAGTTRGVRWVEAQTGRLLAGSLVNPDGWRVECAALSPDGRSLAMGRWAGVPGTWRGRVEWWDPAGGARRDETPDQPEPIRIVAYSPDGRTLFSCGYRKYPEEAALWDVATGRRLRMLMRSLGRIRVRQAAFHPAGRGLLLACSDGRARLWDVGSDTEVDPGRPLVHAAPVVACAFDPEGRRALTGCQDGSARLWDMATRRPLLETLRHDAEVSAVAFSPDGRTLLTGSVDATARFWDADSGKPLGPALRHADGVRAAAFDAGGRLAVTGGRDQAVHHWHLPPPPVDGSVERIRLWSEVLSGMALDPNGTVRDLSAEDLGMRQRRLEALGGPPRLPSANGPRDDREPTPAPG